MKLPDLSDVATAFFTGKADSYGGAVEVSTLFIKPYTLINSDILFILENQVNISHDSWMFNP